MGKSPCCNGEGVKKGHWDEEEDEKLKEYIEKHGQGNWRTLPKKAGLNRCCKSCRLRWTNYLRPDIKRGNFSDEEEHLIIHLHSIHGNKWSPIATHLAGRTDNEIKNYWNTHIKKKLERKGIDPVTHQRRCTNLDALEQLPSLLTAAARTNLSNMLMPNSLTSYLKLTADVTQLAKIQLQNLLLSINPDLLHPDTAVIISSLMGFNSTQNNQFSHFTNMSMNVIRETSDLSFLNSNTFDTNLGLPMQNQPCSFTTSSNNDGSAGDKQLGSPGVPGDYYIPPLVPVAQYYNAATTQIDPTVRCSTISTVNSSSSTTNSIVSNPFEPWDVKHFIELDSVDIGWKDILERMSSSCTTSTPFS